MHRLGIHRHTRVDQYIQATANASGLAQGSLGPVPAGYGWYVERLTTRSNSTGSPALHIFSQPTNLADPNFSVTSVNISGRQDYTPTAVNDVADEVNAIFVPSEWFLVAIWLGCNNGDLCQLSTQIAWHETLESMMVEHSVGRAGLLPAIGAQPEPISLDQAAPGFEPQPLLVDPSTLKPPGA